MIDLLRRIGFKPYSVTWELTLACNLCCRHCGSRAGKPRPDELSEAEALRVAHDLVALGTRRVTLAGGEPTMRPDWPMIAGVLTSGGVKVNILTNGRTWSRDDARRARAFGLESVAFSVDGLEASHDYIRRVKGHWAVVRDAIAASREVKLPVGAVTQINRRNLGELEALYALLGEWGVASWQLQLGNPSGNMADHADLVIEPSDVLDIVPQVARLRKTGRRPWIYVGDNIGYYGPHERDLRDHNGRLVPFWVGCRAGCTVLGIESNGNIKGCLSLPSAANDVDRFVEGNIRERPLADIWNDPDAFAFNRKFEVDQLSGLCRTCDYADICRGGCSWTAFSHTGDCRDNPYCFHRQAVLKG